MKNNPSDLQIAMVIALFAVINKKKYWWPKDQEGQIAWWTNYPTALTANKVALGASAGELTTATNDSAMFLSLYENEATFRIWVAQYMKYRVDIVTGKTQDNIGAPPVLVVLTYPTTVVMGMMDRTFAYIIALKKRTGYNDTIGTALLVIGADYPGFDPETYEANGKATGTTDYVKLTYKKGKFIGGMETWRQRGTDPKFYSLGKFVTSGGKDADLNLVAGQPEIRQYYNRAFIGLNLIGVVSPTYKVTWTSPLPPPPPPPVV